MLVRIGSGALSHYLVSPRSACCATPALRCLHGGIASRPLRSRLAFAPVFRSGAHGAHSPQPWAVGPGPVFMATEQTNHRDFLAIPDFNRDELVKLFELAERMRKGE